MELDDPRKADFQEGRQGSMKKETSRKRACASTHERMPGLSKRGKLAFCLAYLLELVSSLSFVQFISCSAEILNHAQEGSLPRMMQAVGRSFAFLTLKFAAAIGATWGRLAFLSDGTIRMRGSVMRSMFCRPIRSFRKQNDAYYLNLLSTDTDMYATDRLNMVFWICSGAADLVIYAVALLVLNPWLLAVSVALSTPPFVIGRMLAAQTQRRKRAYSDASEEWTATLKDGIEGYEPLRMGLGTASYLQRFLDRCTRKQRAYSASSLTNTVSMQMLYVAACLLNVGCTAVGGWLLIRGVLTVPMLFAAVSYSGNLSNAFSNLAEYLITFSSTKRIAEKLRAECQADAAPRSGKLDDEVPEIIYENVSFSFGERKLYEGFSYRFRENGCYAVIGESGSGKSTLLKLLLKYYDDYGGTIRLSGRDIRELSEDEIYEAVGVVDQTPFLFDASLHENVTLFRHDISEDSEEYRMLLQDVNLTALAERVGNQPLGDFGDHISGGERQRIGIARTLLRHPRIVLFDEPTTGLDPENASLIYKFIFTHKDVLRIVIGHNWEKDFLEKFDDVILVGATMHGAESIRTE